MSLSDNQRGRPDFRIYTASLVPDTTASETPQRSTVVRMTGSSTERDVQRNLMGADALRDMQAPSVLGMNIFLNHKYELPYDLFGRLVEVPTITNADGFLDVGLTVETDIKNAAAAQTLQQIHDGHKHGSSIGCMVDEWDFAGESDNPLEDAIVIKHVTPVEWSVVGIPANRRCWVQNAISGKFLRTLDEEDYDQAAKLAPTVKSLFSIDYERATMRLSGPERTLFAKIPARKAPPYQLFWQPTRSIFIMRSTQGEDSDLSRTEVTEILHTSWEKDEDAASTETLPELDLVSASNGDGGKAAQKARSARYGIGVKEGGNVTKPGKWSSVPDSQWGDPVNYRYPMPDKAHADNAASRWGSASNRSQYNSKEQGIIGGRIKRRQAHFGSSSDSKEKSLNDTAIYDENGVLVTTLDAQGLHQPLDTTHTHAHSHGPGSASHTHPHIHHNDNLHQHDHTGNIDGDGGAPDGDGDSDEWNEPDFPTSGSNAVHPPNDGSQNPPRANDAQSNPGRANNADSSSAPSTPAPPPGALKQSPAEHVEALLAHYNKVGASLGFATVNAEGIRSDGVTLAGENTATFTRCIEEVQTLSRTLHSAVQHMATELHLELPELTPLDGKPELTLAALAKHYSVHAQSIHDHARAMSGDTACGASKGGSAPGLKLSAADAVRIQAVHDHANAMLDGEACTHSMLTPGVTSDATPDVQKQLQEAEGRLLTLSQQIESLTGRGLGRPTDFVGRSVPAGFVGPIVDIQALSPEEMRAGTLLSHRADGVKCRKWPSGHGAYQRPPLTADQMSIMSTRDMDDYHAGREVLVPIIFEGD